MSQHPSQRTGIYAGTFDPITKGHEDIILRACKVVDHLIIGVAEDTGKSPLFGLQKRVTLVQAEIDRLQLQNQVTVEGFSGLLVKFAEQKQASLLIRGLRAVSDYEYEFQMANTNHKLSPEIETVFLTASESTHFISSRFVKQVAKLDGDVSHFVSDAVAESLRAAFA